MDLIVCHSNCQFYVSFLILDSQWMTMIPNGPTYIPPICSINTHDSPEYSFICKLGLFQDKIPHMQDETLIQCHLISQVRLLLIAKEHKGGGNGFPIFFCGSSHNNNVHCVISHMPLGQLVLKRCIGQLSKIGTIPQRLSLVVLEVHNHGSQYQIRYIRVPDLM